MQKQKRARILDYLTYSPQRKHPRFSLLLRFRLHSSLSGRFCKNQLPSLKVAADFNVASSWVSVIPLHTSLSAYNRDSPSSISCLIGIQGRPQPCKEFLSDQSIAKDFSARLSSMFHEVVFVPGTLWIVLPYNFAIHLLPEGRSFSAQMIVNTFPAFITFEYFTEHPLSEIAMSRCHYGCFFINLQGMVYCKNMI